MKRLIKSIMFRVAPVMSLSYFSARARAHSHRMIAQWGCQEINELMLKNLGNKVIGGPFQGMVLSSMTKKEQLGPYLLGLYESELQSTWDVTLTEDFSKIIDVGSKFGYYAVGLARRYPSIPVVAYDTDFWARAATHEMIEANDVKNLSVQGICTSENLCKELVPRTLVLSDCEGFEARLFNDDVVRSMRDSTAIIETHDDLAPGTTEMLTFRFQDSHVVRCIKLESEIKKPNLDLAFLAEHQQQLAIREVRGNQVWLHCTPRVL